MSTEEITQQLREALRLLLNGRVALGIEILNIIGEFDNKTVEQVELLERIDKALYR